MTTTPYPISGIVYDIDGSSVVSGATVTAYNETTGEELPTNAVATTNDSRAYVIDLANFPSGYSDGDVIVVKATKSGTDKIKEYRTVVDTSQGSEEKDLILTYYDVLGLIKEILESNWRKGNTDLQTPTIKKIFDMKRIDISSLGNKDYILLYEMPTIIEKNSLGVSKKRMIFPLSIDIRSTYSREHTIKVRNEVDRILNSNIISPASGWDIIDPDRGWRDLSDKSIKLWRFVLDVEVEKLNMDRTNEWWS